MTFLNFSDLASGESIVVQGQMKAIYDDNTCDIDMIDPYQEHGATLRSFTAVDIHFHCWDSVDPTSSEADEDGYLAFIEDDLVTVLCKIQGNYPDRYLEPVAVTGFVGETRTCVEKFYIRPRIDGNPCWVGGQQFFVEYKNTSGDWIQTLESGIVGFAGGGDTERYHYCGPFELTQRDKTEPVRIHLMALKDRTIQDPPLSQRVIEDEEYRQLTNMFEYYIKSPSGAHQVFIIKYGKGIQLQDFEPDPRPTYMRSVIDCSPIALYAISRMAHVVCKVAPRGNVKDLYTPIIGEGINRRYGFESPTDEEESWLLGTDIDRLQFQWFKSLPQRYDAVESIYEAFAPDVFDAHLDNKEDHLYNYVDEVIEDNPRVFDYNFIFSLKGRKKTVPDDWDAETSKIVHSVGEIFDVNPNHSMWNFTNDETIYFGEYAEDFFDVRLDLNNGELMDVTLTGEVLDGVGGGSVGFFPALWNRNYAVERSGSPTPLDDRVWAIRSKTFLFNGYSWRNIEEFFDNPSFNLVNVVTGNESPLPTSVDVSGNLQRTWGIVCYSTITEDEEVVEIITVDLGGPYTNAFSVISEDLPIHFY